MNGRSGAAGTGGKRRAGIDGAVGGGGGLQGVRVQARPGRRTGWQTGKPTAQIEPKSRVRHS